MEASQKSENEPLYLNIRQWMARTFDCLNHLDSDFLRSEGWVAVPVESGMHFSAEDAVNIANAMSMKHLAEVNALLNEDLKNISRYLRVDVSKSGIQKFGKEYGSYNYVLVPDDLSFAIICTTYDYYLICGDRRFVECALGMRIPEAMEKFRDYASDEDWRPEDNTRLLEVYEKYREFAR